MKNIIGEAKRCENMIPHTPHSNVNHSARVPKIDAYELQSGYCLKISIFKSLAVYCCY